MWWFWSTHPNGAHFSKNGSLTLYLIILLLVTQKLDFLISCPIKGIIGKVFINRSQIWMKMGAFIKNYFNYVLWFTLFMASVFFF